MENRLCQRCGREYKPITWKQRVCVPCRKRVCLACGKEFIADKPDRVYCSVACLPQVQSQRQTRVCEQCGAEYEIRPYEKGFSKFCSKQCLYESRRNRIVYTCECCGKVAESKVSRGFHRFCSTECARRVMPPPPPESALKGSEHPRWLPRVTIVCGFCQRSFEVRITDAQVRKYCSYRCKFRAEAIKHRGSGNHKWRGGQVDYRGPNWNEQRQAARDRDEHTCQRCGRTEAELGRTLDVHHIRPFREYGLARYLEANQLDNLVSLCDSCHMTVEANGLDFAPKMRGALA